MMARVHSQLYQSENLNAINLGDYIKGLIPNLFQIYTNPNTIIRLNFAADDILLDGSLAILCASIFCELISNVLKHAFPEDRKVGEIWLSLTSKASQELTLVASDDGIGLLVDLDVKRLRTMGLPPLVNSLVK